MVLMLEVLLGGVAVYAVPGLLVTVGDAVLSRWWHGGVEARFRKRVPVLKVRLGVFALWPLFVDYWVRMFRRGYHETLEKPAAGPAEQSRT